MPLSAGQILTAHKTLKVADAMSAKARMPIVDEKDADAEPILPKASKLARSRMTGRAPSSENMNMNAIRA